MLEEAQEGFDLGKRQDIPGLYDISISSSPEIATRPLNAGDNLMPLAEKLEQVPFGKEGGIEDEPLVSVSGDNTGKSQASRGQPQAACISEETISQLPTVPFAGSSPAHVRPPSPLISFDDDGPALTNSQSSLAQKEPPRGDGQRSSKNSTVDPETKGSDRWEYLRRLHQPRVLRPAESVPSMQGSGSTTSNSSRAHSADHAFNSRFAYDTSLFPRPKPPSIDLETLRAALPQSKPKAKGKSPAPSLSQPPSRIASSKSSHDKSRTESPLPAPSGSRPKNDLLASAYEQTIATSSTRLTVPDSLVCPHPPDEFQTSLMQSWTTSGIHSDPARQAQLKRFIKRLNEIINDVFNKQYGANGTVTPTSRRGWRYRVEPFGSVSWDGTTGFGDLDLIILDSKLPRGYEPKVWRQPAGMPAPPPVEKPKGRARNQYVKPNTKVPSLYNVDRLAHALQSYGMTKVQPIKFASVPIVKFVEPNHGWQCDINVNELGGWFNSQLILAYCNVNPHLVRPYIHTLKLWAANRGINDPAGSDGLITLSSYCLTMMAISYLQIRGCLPNLQECTAQDIERIGGEKHNVVFVDWQNDQGTPLVCCFNRHPPPDWRPTEPDLTAADAVRGFFEYFSTNGPVRGTLGRFDYPDQALSVLHGGLLPRVKERRPADPGITPQEERLLVGDAGRGVQPRVWFDNRFVVQDPFIYTKSIARNINKKGFHAIIQEIDRAHARLSSGIRDEFWYLCEDFYTA